MLEPFILKYPQIPYGYILEIKYFKRDEITAAKQDRAIQTAHKQLQHYLQSERVQRYGTRIQFQGIVLVYHGWELVHRGAV